MIVHLLTGGNLGNRYENLQFASKSIALSVGKILRESTIYETSAWGVENQPKFLNQVIEVETQLAPKNMLKKIQAIEIQAGRTRHQKWHARTLDIDILFIENQVIKSHDLIVPHPHLQDRNFTLVPLAELIPDFQHPCFKVSISELLNRSTDPLTVHKYKHLEAMIFNTF